MFGKITSISLKFILVLVPTVTLCTLIFLGLFVFIKYSELRQQLSSKIELIGNIHALAVAEPLWMLNYESMYRNLGTIAVHPEVLCVEVLDNYKKTLHGWSQRDCAEFKRSDNVFRTNLTFNNEEVGQLTLFYSDKSIIEALTQEIEIAASLFILLVVATIITALMALRMIIGVPLKHLLKSIRIADKENRRVPVAWSSNDELGQVITAYNTMIRQVDQRESDLENARLHAEHASRTKSDFLANMSHELRNPLNAIIGFSRIVMRRSKTELPPRQYDNLEKILSSSEHLLSLINNILDLSKIEAGRMEIHRKQIDIRKLLEHSVQTMEPMTRSKGLRLISNLAADLPTICSDEEKIKQILFNLLSNAVKFTKQGSVTLCAICENGTLEITVSDTGIGIPAQMQEYIFDEFRQLDSGSTKEYGGTGLGLSISRHLVELLGGAIIVESMPDRGSTFTVTLPVQIQSDASEQYGRGRRLAP